MLPAPPSRRPRLADVLPSCLAALSGERGPIALPSVRKAVVVLVDGLGASALSARSGHARSLAGAMTKGSTASTSFPSTTASAIASLTTGATPAQHGLVGYSTFDRAGDRVVNQLTGWDERMRPESWQPLETVFSRAEARGVPSFAIGHPRFEDSGFSLAVLRGARYRSGTSIADRFDAARRVLDEESSALVYLYVAELDKTGHAKGWQSPEWTHALEEFDDALGTFAVTLRSGEGMLVTADHGMIDVPERDHVLVDRLPGLVDDVHQVAGEPRCLQLRLVDGCDPDRVLERWREALGDRAWVVGRDELIGTGWLGDDVTAEARDRLGDIVVVGRGSVAFYDARSASEQAMAMIGQHGAITSDELVVPLARFGAFAR